MSKNSQQYIASDRLVIGIPAYGYYGENGSYDLTVTTSREVRNLIDESKVVRDPYSYELIYKNEGKTFVWNDETSLSKKRALLESVGVKYISVWAIGGGVWFTD